MWPAMEQKLARFRELETQLSDPVISCDPARFAVVAKEHGALAKAVKPYIEFLRISGAIAETV